MSNSFPIQTIEKVKIAEITQDELTAPSGIYADDEPRQLTNLQAITDIESHLHQGRVYISQNGTLSDEANKHNSAVTIQSPKSTSRTGNYIVAVMSDRPGK